MEKGTNPSPHRAASKPDPPSSRLSLLGAVIESGDDFLDSKQLRAYFPRPLLVEHHSSFSDSSRGIRQGRRVERWERQRELGRGAFGTVYLEAESRGAVRAVKEIPQRAAGFKTLHHLREILPMAKLSEEGSAYFIRLLGWFQSPEYVHIAMEYAPYGDLRACVQGSLPEIEAQSICQQTVQALSIMHEKCFVHRDLSPANIFVVQKGPRWWVKLGDFGMSKRALDKGTGFHTSIESAFTAPEMLHVVADESEESTLYTSAVDMWSLGFLIHWLLTHRYPLAKAQLYGFCLGKKAFPTEHLVENEVPNRVQELIERLVRPDPQQRMTAKEALSHPWLQPLEDLDDGSDTDSLNQVDLDEALGQASTSTLMSSTCPDVIATAHPKGSEFDETLLDAAESYSEARKARRRERSEASGRAQRQAEEERRGAGNDMKRRNGWRDCFS